MKFIRMKIHVLAFLAVSVTAQEPGFLIEEEMTVPPLFGRPQKVIATRTWIAGNRIRKDIGEKKQTWIFNPSTNTVWMVDHSSKTYAEFHSDVFQGLAVMAFMMFGAAADSGDGALKAPEQMFSETGRTAKINGWNCKEVVATPNGKEADTKLTLWMSLQTGLDSRIFCRLLRRVMGEENHQYDGLFKQIEAVGGYPVLIESRLMGGEMKQKLLRVERLAVSDFLFAIPNGYIKKENGLDE